jgi:hypothetical protein
MVSEGVVPVPAASGGATVVSGALGVTGITM